MQKKRILERWLRDWNCKLYCITDPKPANAQIDNHQHPVLQYIPNSGSTKATCTSFLTIFFCYFFHLLHIIWFLIGFKCTSKQVTLIITLFCKIFTYDHFAPYRCIFFCFILLWLMLSHIIFLQQRTTDTIQTIVVSHNVTNKLISIKVDVQQQQQHLTVVVVDAAATLRQTSMIIIIIIKRL